MELLMKLSKVFLAVTTLCMAGGALAHGYVTEPASRAALCTAAQGNQNKDCGAGPQYEPQSVEGPDGFPALNAGPADGHLASAGVASMVNLDQQSASRWTKHPMKAGKNSFTWKFTAAHKTGSWKYYITKANWNPNQPLTRNSFEAQPFCEVTGNGAIANTNPKHECDVPERDGYQVIMAAWDVSDTGATFYNVIDVDFGGNNPAPAPGDEEENPAPGDEGDTPAPGDEGDTPAPGDEGDTPAPGDEGDTPAPGDNTVAAWNATTVYSAPCQKVSYQGKVWVNGWWTRGEAPSAANQWGVWREPGSASAHTACK
jgi:chitin-binding protein